MSSDNIDKKKKWKKILWWIAGIFGSIGILTIVPSIILDNDILAAISVPSIIFALIATVINIKHYNTIPFLVALTIFSMFMKFMHWPGSGVMLTLSLGLLSIISVIISFKYLKNKNLFLKWIGFFANIILPTIFLAFLFKNMHWPLSGAMNYIGTFLFIILIFAIVFTLPNSKYIEWTKLDKKSFYRAILIPMIFIFILTTMDFLANDTLQLILGKEKDKTPSSFISDEIIIIPHEGISLNKDYNSIK